MTTKIPGRFQEFARREIKRCQKTLFVACVWGLGISFLAMVFFLIFPVFFQATNCPVRSSLLTILRTVVLFVPLGYIFARFGLKTFWFTYPVTETITSIVGFVFYLRFIKANQSECEREGK